jgi:FlaA1/EpsC-like NDP-sugar epimerase
VAIEDLLGRPPVEIRDSLAPAVIRGRVALVTGAGGSIGSELCRQILALGPAKLVLLERSENALYEIRRDLVRHAGAAELVDALADVGDERRVEEVFAEHRPQVIFHAAAHKHVPITEANPGEAVKNNLFGTKVVADLALRYACERFVLISTDKAVRPTSVMGATKRLAELYVCEINARGPVRFTVVRFGNVLGSSGSVIPLFREQIAKGGPVTVTHPEMQRYFMTIPEAARLVLEAAGMGNGGEVMVLDMGEPIRIRTLAEQMIQLSGFRPGEDIEVRYIGLRPGEKLSEELVHDAATLRPTACKGICVSLESEPKPDIHAMFALLRELPDEPEAVRELLGKILPEYSPGRGASLQARQASMVRTLPDARPA